MVASKDHAQVRTQQSNRSRLRKTGSGGANTLRRIRKTLSINHAGVAASCASNTAKIDVAGRSGLREGLRGCRQRGKFRCIWWSPSGRYFADFFARGREVALAAQAQTTFESLSKCSPCPLKHDIKLGKVLAACLTPPSGATSMRAQRVALCRQNSDSSCAAWCVPLVASAHLSSSLATSAFLRSVVHSCCWFCLLSLQHSSAQTK